MVSNDLLLVAQAELVGLELTAFDHLGGVLRAVLLALPASVALGTSVRAVGVFGLGKALVR